MFDLPEFGKTTLQSAWRRIREGGWNGGVVVLKDFVEFVFQLLLFDVGNHRRRPAVKEQNGRFGGLLNVRVVEINVLGVHARERLYHFLVTHVQNLFGLLVTTHVFHFFGE